MAVRQNAAVFIVSLTLISVSIALPTGHNAENGQELKRNPDQWHANEITSSDEIPLLTTEAVPSIAKDVEGTNPESIYVRTKSGRLIPVSSLLKSHGQSAEKRNPNIEVIKHTFVVTELVHDRDTQNSGRAIADIHPATGTNRHRGIFNRMGLGNGLHFPQPNFLVPPHYNLGLSNEVHLSGQMQSFGEAGALKADLRGHISNLKNGVKVNTLGSNGAEPNRIFLLPSNPGKTPIVIQTRGSINVSQQQTENGKTKLVIRQQPAINGNGIDATRSSTNGNRNDASQNSAKGNNNEPLHNHNTKMEEVEEV
ncbi:hypothetical protein ACJMK2_024687 [Sinanodonta woodiana]|uniref:Uncharacterized protein n=1 Tax=Sinanodonta woodiana TaxID=1069815 RepID=A0ABD3XE49_SINWO